VRRVLTFLLLLVLVATNGTAVATVLCQHQDAQAHAAALQSEVASDVAEAAGEETAAKTAGKKAAGADASASLLAAYMLPPSSPSLAPGASDAVAQFAMEGAVPPGRLVEPLLRPPHA